MPDDRAPRELAFVGAGRQLLVEGLLAAFDQVNETNRPLWVALEAPSGWGKARVAREFYEAAVRSEIRTGTIAGLSRRFQAELRRQAFGCSGVHS